MHPLLLSSSTYTHKLTRICNTVNEQQSREAMVNQVKSR